MNYVLLAITSICIVVGIVLVVKGFLDIRKRRLEAGAKIKEEKL